MTNENKALFLSGLEDIPDEEERYYNRSKCEIYDKCLEMARWKDKQFDAFLDYLISLGDDDVIAAIRLYRGEKLED